MKKRFFLTGVLAVMLSFGGRAADTEKAIHFIFDGHLFFQVSLNDTIPATVIYDTGADFLYLDEDFLKLNHLQNAFGKKGRAKMGGAGNSDPQPVDVFFEPVKIHCGGLDYRNKITPVIKLRDILGRHTDGLLGNTHLLKSPLEISFSGRYIKPLKEPLSDAALGKYQRLEARFEDNRIDVKARLQIDSVNILEGWFRLDLGCGSSVVLTKEAAATLHLDGVPKVRFRTQAGGVGGSSEEVLLRAGRLSLADTLENVVIKYSLNDKGALSSERPYLGLIGNRVWSLYDMILDPVNAAVWVRRNGAKGSYFESSTTHMEVFDRTDIDEGWVVNGLYEGGIAEKAGFEIGDVILTINNRPVKEISWKEQRKGLGLKGQTKYIVRKANGDVVTYVLFIQEQII